MDKTPYILPEDWEWRKLGEVLSSTSNLKPSDKPNSEWTYIDISSVNNSTNRIEAPKQIIGKEAPSRAKKEVRLNDVLFATTRPNLKNIAIYEYEFENPVASTGFCILRSNKYLYYKYLYYFSISEFLQMQIEPYISGASYPAITDRNLKRIVFPLPPFDVQKRIVEKLDALLSRIDHAIKELTESLKLVDDLFASSLNEAFNPLGSKKNAEGVYELPEGWEWKILTDVAQFVGGSQPPKSEFSKERKDNFVRLIQIRDYKTDKHIVYVNRNSTKKFCSKDDVMIGRYGPPVFQILRGLEGAYNVALMKAIPDEDILSKDYLFSFLQSPSIQNYIVGLSQRAAGQTGVNKKALENYYIPIPTLAVQKRIIDRLNKLSDHQTELKDQLQLQLDELQDLKSSLLDAAFRGEL